MTTDNNIASGNIRAQIREWHRQFDGLMGRLFSKAPNLGSLTGMVEEKPDFTNFEQFGYSRYDHFKCFDPMPIYLTQSPATCDLKVYQDLFAYTFIRKNIKPGARLLEIGGGESRVIPALQNDYEVWNLDKLEGVGFGPRNIRSSVKNHLVRDYIGAFNPDLPDDSFDLVFSISTVEHFSNEVEEVNRILKDIQRLIRPGGYSLHCVDALLFPGRIYVHPFIARARELIGAVKVGSDYNTIIKDEDLWLLPWFAYYTRWYHLTRKPLGKFGYPFSMNICWRKG
jgi:SAM-dependent methyltransferase